MWPGQCFILGPSAVSIIALAACSLSSFRKSLVWTKLIQVIRFSCEIVLYIPNIYGISYLQKKTLIPWPSKIFHHIRYFSHSSSIKSTMVVLDFFFFEILNSSFNAKSFLASMPITIILWWNFSQIICNFSKAGTAGLVGVGFVYRITDESERNTPRRRGLRRPVFGEGTRDFVNDLEKLNF